MKEWISKGYEGTIIQCLFPLSPYLVVSWDSIEFFECQKFYNYQGLREHFQGLLACMNILIGTTFQKEKKKTSVVKKNYETLKVTQIIVFLKASERSKN